MQGEKLEKLNLDKIQNAHRNSDSEDEAERKEKALLDQIVREELERQEREFRINNRIPDWAHDNYEHVEFEDYWKYAHRKFFED